MLKFDLIVSQLSRNPNISGLLNSYVFWYAYIKSVLSFFIYVTTFMLLFALLYFFPFSSLCCKFSNVQTTSLFEIRSLFPIFVYLSTFPTFKVTLCCLFLLLSAIFPFLAQHWAMWKTAFGFFYGLRIFVSHFSQFLLHLVNQNHSLRIVLVNIFTHVKKIAFAFPDYF